MTTLYELSIEYQAAFNNMQDMDLDAETIKDSLSAIKGEFEEKAINCIKWEKGIAGDIAVIDEEIKRLQAMKAASIKQRDSFHNYIINSMTLTGIVKIKCPVFSITIRKPMKVVNIIDEALLPEKFTSTIKTVKIDKKAIKQALKTGTVDGAELIDGKRGLSIK